MAAAVAASLAEQHVLGLDKHWNEQIERTWSGHLKRAHSARQERKRVAPVPYAKFDGAQVAAERLESVQKVYDEAENEKLKQLFEKYDTNKSGWLELEQLSLLLTDLDSTTPPGTPPSEEEVAYILKAANSTRDDALSLEELDVARLAWNTYIRHRGKWEEVLQKYDHSGTGKLEIKELKEYLVNLNHGQPVTDEEVRWVFDEANLLGDDGIGRTELSRATGMWYMCCGMRRVSKAKAATAQHQEAPAPSKPSSCCMIL